MAKWLKGISSKGRGVHLLGKITGKRAGVKLNNADLLNMESIPFYCEKNPINLT